MNENNTTFQEFIVFIIKSLMLVVPEHLTSEQHNKRLSGRGRVSYLIFL